MEGRTDNLVVDVVANQGHTWVKVIARKAQALHLIWAGTLTDLSLKQFMSNVFIAQYINK